MTSYSTNPYHIYLSAAHFRPVLPPQTSKYKSQYKSFDRFSLPVEHLLDFGKHQQKELILGHSIIQILIDEGFLYGEPGPTLKAVILISPRTVIAVTVSAQLNGHRLFQNPPTVGALEEDVQGLDGVREFVDCIVHEEVPLLQ